MTKNFLGLSLCLFSALATGCTAGAAGDDVSESDSALTDVVRKGTVLRVTATALNLRASGTTSSRVILTLAHNDKVTCIETSGSTGWVHVKAKGGEEGWVFSRWVARISDPVDEPEAPPVVASRDTCSPTRAANTVNRYQKALHDLIAYAEGTRGRSKDGYDVMFGYRIMSSCNAHPQQCVRYGNTCSTAAGRYQFLTNTWEGVARAKRLSSFEPENQEIGAAYLVASVRRVNIPSDRPLTASEFTNAITKLSYEWASLPPGQYGQPSRSMTELHDLYCTLVDC